MNCYHRLQCKQYWAWSAGDRTLRVRIALLASLIKIIEYITAGYCIGLQCDWIGVTENKCRNWDVEFALSRSNVGSLWCGEVEHKIGLEGCALFQCRELSTSMQCEAYGSLPLFEVRLLRGCVSSSHGHGSP